MSFIERMRSKPQHIKARYAFLSALFVTGAIGAFWATSLPAKFMLEEQASVTKEDAVNGSASNKKDLSDLFSNTKDQLGAAIDAIEERQTPEVERATGTTGARATSTSTSTPQTQQDDGSEMENVGTSTTPKPAPRTVLIATTSSDKGERTDQ